MRIFLAITVISFSSFLYAENIDCSFKDKKGVKWEVALQDYAYYHLFSLETQTISSSKEYRFVRGPATQRISREGVSFTLADGTKLERQGAYVKVTLESGGDEFPCLTK